MGFLRKHSLDLVCRAHQAGSSGDPEPPCRLPRATRVSRIASLGRPPVVPLCPFLGEGYPTKIDYRNKTRVPSYSNLSNLEDLVLQTAHLDSAYRSRYDFGTSETDLGRQGRAPVDGDALTNPAGGGYAPGPNPNLKKQSKNLSAQQGALRLVISFPVDCFDAPTACL